MLKTFDIVLNLWEIFEKKLPKTEDKTDEKSGKS